jgi:phosphoribosylformylglycinamidine synthase
VTLAESCFGPKSLGADVRLPNDIAVENALFGERGARSIVSVAPENIAALQSVAAQYGVAADQIGQVTGDGTLRIQYKGRAIIDSPVESLRDIWANSIERAIKSEKLS